MTVPAFGYRRCVDLSRPLGPGGGRHPGFRYEARTESIDSFGMYTPEQEYFSNVILGQARKLSIDGDGRIVLPLEFLDHAAVDGLATFVGGGKQFHIWRPDRYEEYKLEAKKSAPGFTLPPPRQEPAP